ncbi:MAG: hemolysin family protein [Acidimicrobiia bacterium]
MSALQIVYLVVLGLCVLASGFFSGSETALVAVPRERVEQLGNRDRRAEPLVNLTADPDHMLSTLLLANNFVNILAASVATVLFIDLLGEDWGPWLATLSVTSVILLIGEITPKSLATRYPERFSLTVAPVIWRLARVLRPVSRLFLTLSRGLFRIFRLRAPPTRSLITDEDLRAMAVLGERSGDIEAVEREIIDALFHLDERSVREVMTPRADIHTLASPVTIENVREAVAASGHSRFPVIREDPDHLIGILYVKDLLRMQAEPSPGQIRRALREPYYVPESRSVLALLQEMRSRRAAFAVVLDEHGGVEGVVTIKDLVSELVGELQDEYDPGSPAVVPIGSGRWISDGRVPVEDLAAAITRELPAGPYATVGGLFLDLAGRIPQEGDTVVANGVRLTVIEMDRQRIDRVRVELAG